MSKKIFNQLSQLLLEKLATLYRIVLNILNFSPSMLELVAQTPFNLEHILEFMKLSNEVDQLMINLFLGHEKNDLHKNPENQKRLFLIYQKMELIVLMTQEAYKVPQESRSSDLVSFIEILAQGCQVLVYEFSCLQKIIPLMFTEFLSLYFELAARGLFELWENDTILKSFCFMVLKLLKTYVYYQGSPQISGKTRFAKLGRDWVGPQQRVSQETTGILQPNIPKLYQQRGNDSPNFHKRFPGDHVQK